MKMKIIICLNLLCSLCPLAFGAPEAMADPDIVIQVKQIVGSSDQVDDNDGGLSDDGAAADEAPTEEGYMTEAPAEQEYTTEVPPIECPTESGWEKAGEGCYWFIVEDHFDRTGAEAACKVKDGSARLAHLDTEEKRAAVYTQMKEQYYYGDDFWIGAEYNANTESYLWDGTSVQVEWEAWSSLTEEPDTEESCVISNTNYQSQEGKYDTFKSYYCGAKTSAALCELTNAGANTGTDRQTDRANRGY